MTATALLLALLMAAGDETKPAAWHDPRAAFAIAAEDAAALGPSAQFVRYVFNETRDPDAVRWHVYTVNECVADIRNPAVVRPTLLAGGLVIRWDLRDLAPRTGADGSADVFRLMGVWDSIFDASLSVRLLEPIRIRIATPPYVASDGKTYRFKIIERDATTSDLFEPFGSRLQAVTLSNTPLLSLAEFQRAALQTLDGGKYYDLLNLPATSEELLALFGADRAAAERLRSDIKAVTVVSGVTHSPRRIIIIPGAASRPSDNQGLVWITEDFALATIAAGNDPARNLHGRAHDASEIIIERPNGGHVYYLADGQGRRQDAAPDNIADDDHFRDSRLQPAKSCIVCHAINQERGLRSFAKDVDAALRGPLDNFGERGVAIDQAFDQTMRTVGQYRWNPRKMVDRTRDDYSDFCIRCTDTMQPEQLGDLTREFFVRYWEEPVDARQALAELGVDPPSDVDAAAQLLAKRCPPLPAEILAGVRPEDIYVATLLDGRAITRANFLQVVLELRRRLALADGGNHVANPGG
ncbi:MAG: hypothetical protein ACIALR_16555 [Blastopirellula sp. JB062]